MVHYRNKACIGRQILQNEGQEDCEELYRHQQMRFKGYLLELGGGSKCDVLTEKTDVHAWSSVSLTQAEALAWPVLSTYEHKHPPTQFTFLKKLLIHVKFTNFESYV